MFLKVGELINSTRKRIRSAIVERDGDCIRDLARRQRDAGADIIDLNAGESGERELEDLLWLIGVVEDDLGPSIRLGIDTSDPAIMARAIEACSALPLMNSISNEPAKLPLIKIAGQCGCEVIGLAMGSDGMPRTADDRVREASALVSKCAAAGIDNDKLYVDLICMSGATSPEQGRALLDATRRVRSELSVRPLVAVSNVSFGLPNRRLLNRTFLAMLIEAGLAGAILDPTAPGIIDTICAARALLGADAYCMDYIRHHRAQMKP